MLREPDLTPLPKTLEWSVVNLGRGEKLTGVIAGRVRKFQCHHVGPKKVSKPCLSFATEGKLRCWCEERPASVRPIVYVPVFTAKERFVIRMSSVQGYLVERDLKPGMVALFERPDRAKRPTFAKRVTGESASQGWVVEVAKKANADILEFLCHVWQLHALTKYCGFTPRRSIAGASVVDLSEPDYAPRFSHTEQLLAERLDAEGE